MFQVYFDLWYTLRYRNQCELAPVWSILLWHILVVSSERSQSHKREQDWAYSGLKVAPVSLNLLSTSFVMLPSGNGVIWFVERGVLATMIILNMLIPFSLRSQSLYRFLQRIKATGMAKYCEHFSKRGILESDRNVKKVLNTNNLFRVFFSGCSFLPIWVRVSGKKIFIIMQVK